MNAGLMLLLLSQVAMDHQSADAACMLGAIAAYDKAMTLLDPTQEYRGRSLGFFRERMGKIDCSDQMGGRFKKVSLEIFEADVDIIFVSVEVETLRVWGTWVDHKCERDPTVCLE